MEMVLSFEKNISLAKQGNRRELAKLLTLIESGERLPIEESNNSWVLGVTGPPGVGKSTLIGVMIEEWVGRGEKVAVLAYTDKSAGYKGMSAFIVESSWDGVSLGKKETNMGQRASDTRAVIFEDVHVPVENLIGGVEGAGWFNAMKAFDLSRPNVAAQAVGCSRAAYEYALQYADERKTFDKKLHEHQAIQFMLADMKTKIEASRLLTWRTAWEVDNGVKNTESAAHAKRFAADSCMEITTDAVQVFGGYGYSEEYPVARLMRAAKVLQIYEGSSQVQRMIIGREIVRDL